jgi:hypothetical protein
MKFKEAARRTLDAFTGARRRVVGRLSRAVVLAVRPGRGREAPRALRTRCGPRHTIVLNYML